MQSSGSGQGDIVLRIGTRGSPLALAQAHEVRDRLAAAHGLAAERFAIRIIKTSGDAIQDRPLYEVGGKGLFTKEIEEALLASEIDLAVHSAKDVPTFLPDGLWLASWLPREDPRDVFISLVAAHAARPAGQVRVVGTASLRRRAMVARLRPDLNVSAFAAMSRRGCASLQDGEADATLLAFAGLNRLGLQDKATAIFDPHEFLPAAGRARSPSRRGATMRASTRCSRRSTMRPRRSR